MLCYVYPIDPGTRPDQGLPGQQPGLWPGGMPSQPIYLPPFGWVKPPLFPTPPIHIPPPPGIWNPAFPSFPIYIPDIGWINIPLFPSQLPIILPPALPPGINIPAFPQNPIVIPPMPIVDVPPGKVLVVVVTSEGSKWGVADKNAIVTPPIYGTEPTPK